MTTKIKRVWCKHMTWLNMYDQWAIKLGFMHTGTIDWVPDEWKYCPLCGKKRPV